MTVNDLYTAGAAAITSSGVLGIVAYFLKSALNAALSDLQKNMSKHLAPNGGEESAYDQIVKVRELSQKALEISVANEARLKTLENKVDGLILSRVS